jgi:putative transferase (TIGR04331 family)
MTQYLQIYEFNKDIKKKNLNIYYPFKSPKSILKGSKDCHKIYKYLIKKLSKRLNKIHKVNWPVRSWKILIGPFLSRLIETIYEKWQVLENIKKKYPKIKIKGVSKKNFDFSCVDFNDFTEKTHTIEWNEQIYLYIIKNYFSFKIIKEKILSNSPKKKKGRKFYDIDFKNLILKFISLFFNLFKKKKDGVIYFSYISGIWNKVKLNFMLGQFPQIILPQVLNSLKIKNNTILWNHQRKKILIDSKKKNLNNLINDLGAKIFPIIYLESFKKLKKISENRNFPSNPKFILTSAPATYKDESFKFWAAKKIINSTKLITMQHGGVYGTEYFEHSVPRHELDISDTFLSWGWGKKSKIKKVPSPIILNKNYRHNSNGKILLVFTDAREQFSYFSTDSFWGERSEIYVKEQIELISLLAKKLTNKFDIKLYPAKDFYQKKISNEASAKIKKSSTRIITHGTNFNKLILNYKLSIFNYNGTTFLQTIGTNKPAMLFLDKQIMPHKKNKIFSNLKKAGILHYDKNSLTNKILEVQPKIETWWNKPNVLNARHEFCEAYVRRSKNYLKIYSKAIK